MIKPNEIKQIELDHEYWQTIAEFLGPGWSIIGFTYRIAATLYYHPHQKSQHVIGAFAERLYQLAQEAKNVHSI